MTCRFKNDAYFTPSSAVLALKRTVYIPQPANSIVLEPCAGMGAIAAHFPNALTNDIDPAMATDYHADARTWFPHPSMNGDVSWVITNPPFNQAETMLADQWLPRMWNGEITNGIALLLRLTFLEPTKSRGKLLKEHPPTSLIVLPRHSFTGDGKTDSVTCAWFVWDTWNNHQTISVYTREDLQAMVAKENK
jgi:tRNA1(Val) A37 N6-methylase TrmN6